MPAVNPFSLLPFSQLARFFQHNSIILFTIPWVNIFQESTAAAAAADVLEKTPAPCQAELPLQLPQLDTITTLTLTTKRTSRRGWTRRTTKRRRWSRSRTHKAGYLQATCHRRLPTPKSQKQMPITLTLTLSCLAPPRLLANLILSRRCMQHAPENIKVDIWQAARQRDRQWDRQRDRQDALRDCALIFQAKSRIYEQLAGQHGNNFNLQLGVCVSQFKGRGHGKGGAGLCKSALNWKWKWARRVRISNIHCEEAKRDRHQKRNAFTSLLYQTDPWTDLN